ncbi:hypothetical protein [Haliangium ochraceum]|nr:hypothetical protein [Haliangium ochraceum]
MGFLRKVAGAFVELEDQPGKGSSGSGGGGLDLATLDAETAALLAGLEDSGSAADAGGEASSPAATPPPPRAAGASANSPASSSASDSGGAAGAGALRGMDADAVFAQAGIADSPNSAQRVLKIIAGLKMFPPEQQLTMLRAIDDADPSWSEDAVLEDARRRQLALREHLQAVADEVAAQVAGIRQQIASTQAESQSIIADIDERIATLQKQREEALVATTHSVDELQQHIRQAETESVAAQQRVSGEVDALGNLIVFFGSSKADPSSGPGSA